MNEPELRFKANDGQEYPEWAEKKIINYFPNIRNGFVGTITNSFSDKINGIRYLEGVNIHDGIISDNVELYVTKEFHEAHINNELKATDILMVQSGHVGDCAVVGERYQGSNCHALIIMSNNGNADSLFVVDYFHSPKGIKDLLFLIKGNTVKHILASDIRKYRMKFPCLEEQQKIADLFSALDNVINSAQKEVDSWEQMKRGVMQKLFSQEVRFKADDGSEFPEWGKVKLSDVTCYSKDKIDAKDIMTEEYVSTDTMLQNFAGIKTSETVPTSATLCSFQTGDILMADIRPYLKKIWLADMDGACNSDVLVIRPKNGINSRFIYDGLTQDSFITYVMSSAKGSKMPRGDKKMIMNYEIPEVCFEEQQKIADCLSEFDSVIEKTKQKLEAYKQLKKGLMQRMFV